MKKYMGLLFSLALIFPAIALFKTKEPTPRPEIHGALLTQARTLSPFSLKGTQGVSFNDASLKGKWTFLFFGYTYCPDICPTTLLTLSQLWEKLGNTQKEAQIVFVSVDPERDTIDRLTQYVTHFNPHFLGATGDISQIQQLTQQLGVPFFVSKNETNKTSVQVDHGSMIILLNPYGQYQAAFTAPHEADTLFQDFQKIKIAIG